MPLASDSWRPRRPTRTALQVVVRGLTALALAWQVLWLAADATLWPWHQDTDAGRIAFGLVGVSWAGLLLAYLFGDRRQRRGARLVNVVVLVAAAAVELVQVATIGAGWTATSNATVLAVGAAGILLPVRQAAAAATVAIAAELGVVVTSATSTPARVYPWFAVAVAVAAIAARNSLVQEALAADLAAAESVRRETDRRVHEAVEATMRQRERALHGTVLSTLASIERGGLAGDLRSRLTRLCRESAQVLRGMRPDIEVLGLVEVPANPDEGVDAEPVHEEGVRFAPSAAALAVPVLVSFGALSALVVLSTAAYVRFPRIDILALAVLLTSSAVVVLWSRRAEIPGWLVLVVALAGIATMRLHQLAEPSGASAWFDWASVGIAMLFFVVAAVGPRWAWAVALGAWFVVQGDVVGELLSSGTAILVAAALFGRTTRRNAARSEQARAALHAQALGSAVADASVRRLQRRYAALAESDAPAILDGIATGSLAPEDPRVRRRAAVEERFVRNLVRVDPHAGPLHAIVAELACSARRAGLTLSCDVGDVPLASTGGLTPLRSSLTTALALARSDSDATLSARREGDEVVLRMTVEIAQTLTGAAEVLAVPGAVDPTGAQSEAGAVAMVWEWSTPASEAAPAGS